LTAFSPDYDSARDRFRSLGHSLGATLETHTIDSLGPQGQALSIDAALFSPDAPRRVVIISSGLHGVEGFFGAAVQTAWMERHRHHFSLSAHTGLVLLHALNPYGFAWLRRWNEENVDLNRNFLLPGVAYQGSPSHYPQVDGFLNPTTAPSWFEPFTLKAIALILRYGMTTLKQTIPVGQYDFPKGLFFGGHHPSQTQRILAENLPQWVGTATQVLHIDLHTGLGRWATYKLLTEESRDSERVQRLRHQFGVEAIETLDTSTTAYQIRGSLEAWCKHQFPQCGYDFLTAEFGTYSMLKVVRALRAENRAYWWGGGDRTVDHWSKQQVVEVFAPANPRWREAVIAQGVAIVENAL
jgi:hypothetical protein